MKPILGYFSTQIDKTRNTVREKTFLRCCSLLFLTLGVGALVGASSNQIPILITANAQLEDIEELREEQRAGEVEEEFSSEQGEDQDDKDAGEATTGSHKLSFSLE